VGEWSLATDNCAMWLNGFNDNAPGYPKVKCAAVRCPAPYMGTGQPNAPPDPRKGKQDPYGSGGESTPEYGMCPVDRPFDPEGGFASEDEAMTILASAKLNAFDAGTHGQFFWNFRTEFEPRWDYLDAVKRQWLPRYGDPDAMATIQAGCPPHSVPHRGWTWADVTATLLTTPYIVALVVAVMVINTLLGGYFIFRRRGSYMAIADALGTAQAPSPPPRFDMMPTKLQPSTV